MSWDDESFEQRPAPGGSYRTGGVPPRRSPLLTGLIVFFLLVAVSIAAFQLLRSGDETAGDTTTTTTEPDGDTTTTTDGDSTTSTTTTTSTTLVITPYVPVGEAIPIEDLLLRAAGVGPIDFGTAADEAMGRLVASLGDPDEDTGFITSTGAFGACEGDTVRIVRWGPLATVVLRAGARDSFEGYRLDLSYGGLTAATSDLTTLSGLSAGDSVADIEAIYGDAFEIDYVVETPIGEVFELRGSSDQLLLWGPISSTDAGGQVLGIYAPDICDG